MKESKKFRTWREHHQQFWNAKGYVGVPRLHPVATTIQEQWPMTARELDCLNHVVVTQEMFPGDVVVADLFAEHGPDSHRAQQDDVHHAKFEALCAL